MADLFSISRQQEVHIGASAAERKRVTVTANGPVVLRDSEEVPTIVRAGDSVVVERPVWITPEDRFHGVASLIVFHEGADDWPAEKKTGPKSNVRPHNKKK